MKVLFVMTARTIGGAEIYAERLVTLLRDSCQFTVALSDHPDMADLAHRIGERAQVLAFPFDRTSRLPSATYRLRQLAARHDVIHLNSNHPGSRL